MDSLQGYHNIDEKVLSSVKKILALLMRVNNDTITKNLTVFKVESYLICIKMLSILLSVTTKLQNEVCVIRMLTVCSCRLSQALYKPMGTTVAYGLRYL